MPPEIINQQKYDSKVDIWSACVVIYIMLYGKPPFYSEDKEEVYRQIREKEIDWNDRSMSKISLEARDFLMRGLMKNQHDRMNCKQMLDHPWLSEMSLISDTGNF